jgi:hypothetical protein
MLFQTPEPDYRLRKYYKISFCLSAVAPALSLLGAWHGFNVLVQVLLALFTFHAFYLFHLFRIGCHPNIALWRVVGVTLLLLPVIALCLSKMPVLSSYPGIDSRFIKLTFALLGLTAVALPFPAVCILAVCSRLRRGS